MIGERHGPVLIRTEAELRDPFERPLSRVGRRGAAARLSMAQASRARPLRGSGGLLTAAAALAAAAVGFTLAHGTTSGGAAPALTRHASAGALAISVAPDWRPVRATVAAPVGLVDRLDLAPGRSRGEILVIGRTVTPDPQLLPPTLLASLPSTPTPQTVVLGRATFYRYLNLSPRGSHSSESVYAMSSTLGTVLGVCIAPRTRIGFTASCERSLATVALRSGRALPPGPIPAFAAAINLAISRLNGVRVTAGSQLRNASGAPAQARAADDLAAAYGQAAASLAGLQAGPAGASNAAVVAALTLSQTAYRSLAQDAASRDSAAYRDARTSVRRAGVALSAAYSGLDAFGYTIR